MNTTEIKPIVPIEESQKEEIKELELPVLDAPTFVYKKDTKMFWLGIPADKVDAFTACCIIDSMKLQYLDVSKMIIREMQEKKNNIITPGKLDQLRKNFVSRFKK